MSFSKQSDLKNHLFRRTRSQIHLIAPADQPVADASAGVEKVESPPSPVVNPTESPLDHVPKEYEALRNFLISESSENGKSVRD